MKTHRSFARALVAGVIISTTALSLGGCGTSVKRVDARSVTDLSGAWNDTDSRLVSEEMIQDVLAQAWLPEFTRKQQRQPVVIVGEVRNLSHEHLNLDTFVRDMQRALLNSRKVQFVADRTERQDVREERRDQDLHASEKTRKPMGQEKGADFMLKGTINTIIDGAGSTQVRYYQIDLNLISLADNEMVWLGQKKIKKEVKRGKLRF